MTSTTSGVTVEVNGVNAPLFYVSPDQINFQVPWETPLAPATTNVTVTSGGLTSFAEPITVTSTTPSVFANYPTGVAFLSNIDGVSVLYGNGFGAKNGGSSDGVPANPSSLTAIETVTSCTLTIAGEAAQVQYCGSAPYELIDQLNFAYPSDLVAATSPAIAQLTIGGNTGTFLVMPPQ